MGRAGSFDGTKDPGPDVCLFATVSDEPLQTGSQAGRLDAIEALATRVAAGQDVRLLCWCFPCACHGDTIAALVRARALELHAQQRQGKRRR